MLKIKANDEVIVITGKDRGKRGKVIRVLENGKAVVAGINIVKKHVKPNPQKGTEGGIIEKEAPIYISNIAIYNKESESADRVGFRFDQVDGKVVKKRMFKSSKELVEA